MYIHVSIGICIYVSICMTYVTHTLYVCAMCHVIGIYETRGVCVYMYMGGRVRGRGEGRKMVFSLTLN